MYSDTRATFIYYRNVLDQYAVENHNIVELHMTYIISNQNHLALHFSVNMVKGFAMF